MKKTTKKTIITLVALIAIALLAPVVVGLKNNYMINILCSYCYFGILCCSLNLLLGYTGQISFRQCGYHPGGVRAAMKAAHVNKRKQLRRGDRKRRLADNKIARRKRG